MISYIAYNTAIVNGNKQILQTIISMIAKSVNASVHKRQIITKHSSRARATESHGFNRVQSAEANGGIYFLRAVTCSSVRQFLMCSKYLVLP